MVDATELIRSGAWGEAEKAPCIELARVTCVVVRVVLEAEVGAADRVALGAARVAGVAVASTSPVTSFPASLSASISATSAYWAFSGLGVLILS